MRLRYQKRALQQIEKALAYIAEQSPQGAGNVEARIRDALLQVQQYPHSGKKTPIPGVRRLYLTPYPYHIDYFTGDDTIVVQRFCHAARRPIGSAGQS